MSLFLQEQSFQKTAVSFAVPPLLNFHYQSGSPSLSDRDLADTPMPDFHCLTDESWQRCTHRIVR
jgi:hypothetical protein